MMRRYEREGGEGDTVLHDYGSDPFVVSLPRATRANPFFRLALWTGQQLQLVLMTLPAGGEIGAERHGDTDQLLYIESGTGKVDMGEAKDDLSLHRSVSAGDAILVPAGTWHRVRNAGRMPLRLFTVYAPPEHPYGTIHETIEAARAAERGKRS